MEGINEVQGKRKKTRPPRGAARRSISPHVHSHPSEVRRKAVQLYLEEGFAPEMIAREMGVGKSTLSNSSLKNAIWRWLSVPFRFPVKLGRG
jgi:DNA invertase Pin-like site-specific DNA recombinase